jgi:hypothetical protein
MLVAEAFKRKVHLLDLRFRAKFRRAAGLKEFTYRISSAHVLVGRSSRRLDSSLKSMI